MKKLFICTMCLFCLSFLGKAQIINFNYQMSLPMNQVKDFTSKASFRGFEMAYHQFIAEQFSVGLSVGWDVYYQDKNSATGNFRFNNNEATYTITGNQYRYINYDLDLINQEYENISKKVMEMQMALDRYNQTVQFEVNM